MVDKASDKIFYATDRSPLAGGEAFGSHRAMFLRYGWIDIQLPDCRRYIAHTAGIRTLNDGPYSGGRAFLEALPAKKPERVVMVYVFGYNESFRDNIRRAAQIQHDASIDAVPIVFSWPSANELAMYNYDRESVTLAQEDFSDLIKELSREGFRINIYAHSLGALLTVGSLSNFRADTSPNKPIHTLILASPDIDVDLFERKLPAILRVSERVALLQWPNDALLALSAGVNGSPRLGNTDPNVLQQYGIARSKEFVIVVPGSQSERYCVTGSHHCTETSPFSLLAIQDLMGMSDSQAR